MSQFDVFRLGASQLVVDVQSELLGDLSTRVVIPLVLLRDGPRKTARDLNPVVAIDGEPHLLLTHLLAAVQVRALGPKVGDLREHRDRIIRSLDAVISGI